jgi:ABC-type transport system involved in cytochrome c biogenesis permease subunit
MSKTTSCLRAAASVVLIAGIAVLSGCGPAPYSRSTTSEQTTTTTPAPVISTTTTTTEQDAQHK